MDKATAIRIVAFLADGIDPFSGERLPENSALQNVEIARALFFALSAIRSYDPQKKSVDEYLQKARSEEEFIWEEYCSLSIYSWRPDSFGGEENNSEHHDSEEMEDFAEDDQSEDDNGDYWWALAFPDYDAYIQWKESC